MAYNIFKDPTTSLPKDDAQIVRVSMRENQVGGRQDHIGDSGKSPWLSIQHVPNAGSKE